MTPPSLSAFSSSDELSWIIELLEKDSGVAFQEAGSFGENLFSSSLPILSCPIPDQS